MGLFKSFKKKYKKKKKAKKGKRKSASFFSAVKKRISYDIKDFKKHSALAATGFLFTVAIGVLAVNAGDWHEDYIEAKASGSVVKILSLDRTGGGTGFALEFKSGVNHIVTNAHVCNATKDKNNIVLVAPQSWEGTAALSKILKIDERKDLCLIQGVKGLSGLRISKGDVGLGDKLFVVGHPLLQPRTLSKGRYIATIDVDIAMKQWDETCKGKRGFSFFGGSVCIMTFRSWLTSAYIYPGNSGSPLLNKYGNVVGVVFASNMMTHYGLMIPKDTLVEFLYN